MQEGLQKEREHAEVVSDVSDDAKESKELETRLSKPLISVHSGNKTGK